MKRLLLGLITAGAVGSAAMFATNAFFNDTETSVGNTLVAGAIDLQIDSEAHYAGMICSLQGRWEEDLLGESNNTRPELLGEECVGTWELKNLTEGDTFFNLTDIKPGDSGENTISIHVTDNDHWLCADVSLTENDDNSSTEPELGDGDVADVLADEFDGELAENVHFTAWADDGDNIWEKREPLLFTNEQGPASDVLGGVTYALADSTTVGGPMAGGVTSYIGLQWCHGLMTIDDDANTITCDGSSLNNLTQTDSFVANVSFRAEQSRNNPDFVCEVPEVEVTPES